MRKVDIDCQRLRGFVQSQSISQQRLADQSGLSRSTIGKLLRGKGRISVFAASAEKLAQAIGMPVSNLCGGSNLERYSQVVVGAYSTVDFRGLGMPGIARQRLADIYVDPRIREELPENCGVCPDRGGQKGRTVYRRAASLNADMPKASDCARLRDRAVLLGSPGCGKTTVLKHLACQAASEDSIQWHTVIYVSMPELARVLETDPSADPLTYAAAWARREGCEGIEGALRDALRDRRKNCLVLLDGLDEVGSSEKLDNVLDSISKFIKTYPRNRFVVTSRLVGFEHEPWKSLGFTVYRIEDYKEAEQQELVAKWSPILAGMGNKTAEEVSAALLTAIFTNPQVRILASNPLVLTVCILLYHARGGSLPRRRADLYQRIVDVFLDTWESSKLEADSFHESRSVPLDAREFQWLLSNLALTMQKAGRTLAPRWWIASQIRGYLTQVLGFDEGDAERASDAIIRYLTERTGLLLEEGADVFAFSHRTLLEYFASLGIINEADESPSKTVSTCLREYFYHPAWSEVMRFTATQLPPATAESLVRLILDDPDPAGRFLRRAQLLVLSCLADGATLANRRLADDLFGSLETLGETRWLGITFEALDGLSRLEETRFQSQARETAETILRTAQQSLGDEEFDALHGYWYRDEVLQAACRKFELNDNASAVETVVVSYEGREHQVVFRNHDLFKENVQAWFASTVSSLAEDKLEAGLASRLICELGSRARTSKYVKNELKRTAESGTTTIVRVACVMALASAGIGVGLCRRLLKDESQEDMVRATCAQSLEDVAAENKTVAIEISALLDTNVPQDIREGAARGLEKVATECIEIREELLRLAYSEDEPESLRIACAWSLTQMIGIDTGVTQTFLEWLARTTPDVFQRIAAQALVPAIADDRIPWDSETVQKIEGVLLHLEDPCPEALWTIGLLVSERQVRQSLRLEYILSQALEPVAGEIELAFVFGSVARGKQGIESDVDLFVLGKVSLRALSAPLAEAEQAIGRPVNPVIYSRESYRKKYQAGDPFLLDVYRKEKIPIIGPGDSPTPKEVNDELGSLVAERMAATN